jgi:hypothetical protein
MGNSYYVDEPPGDSGDVLPHNPRQVIDSDVRVSHSVVERTFGGFLQPRDPTDMLGSSLDSFTINTNLTLDGLAHVDTPRLRRDVYLAVDNAMRSDIGGGVACEIVDYNDVKVAREQARRYFTVRLNTSRDTTVTTLFRCFIERDNFYLATNSYLLGRIRWSSVVGHLLLSVFIFFVSIFNPLAWIPAAVYFWWAWADVVRASRFAGRPSRASAA